MFLSPLETRDVPATCVNKSALGDGKPRQPAIRTVFTLQPVFKVLRRASCDQIGKGVSRTLAIVRMNQPFSSFADQIVGRPPKRGVPRRIDIDNIASRIADDEKVLGDVPNAVAFLGLRRDAFGQRSIEAA